MDLINLNFKLFIGLFILFKFNLYVMANNLNLNILSDTTKRNFEENSVLRDSHYNDNNKNNNNDNNKNNKQLQTPPPPQLPPSISSSLSSSSTESKDTFSINDDTQQINNNNNVNRNKKNNNNDNNNNDDDDDDVSNLDVYDDNINDNKNIIVNDEISTTLNLPDQVQLLSKQLNALMTRRRDDYKLLENSLKKSILKNLINSGTYNSDMDIKTDIEQIRNEVKILREGGSNSNKERLTVEWLTQSIAEMRKELTELQEIASNASADLNRRSRTFEDLSTITNDFKSFKLEIEAIKERQITNEILIRELKDESIQKEEDLRKMIRHQSDTNNKINDGNEYSMIIEPEADHRMRHQRFLRQQIHDLEISQHNLKRQLNELQYHRISDRVHNLEIEQRRLANANFNLSRQIVGLDKLHSSMLELLEDVEGIQNKMDKNIPDIKREISKLEFTSAQFNSEQNLLREEGHNVAKSIQAMAVSISALQDERDIVKNLQNSIQKLQQDVERLKSIANIQNSIVQRQIQKIETDATNTNNNNTKEQQHTSNMNNNLENHNNIEMANNLVQQLESVELQYESIINKLPSDCSQVDHKVNGLYLIAPSGQHNPLMAYCNKGGWTTIQRRYDGSIDFNRSWESYSKGFGNPSGEYWIGNEIIHNLTSNNCTQLKIIMQDIYDNVWEAIYKNFYVSSREDGYRLYINNYIGNASDALDYQNKMQFSAIDVDRDISNTHCAANYEGGWWFSHCQHANLNGRYNLGLTWFDGIRNEWIAVKSSHIMVNRRSDCYSNISPMTTESSTTTITSVV